MNPELILPIISFICAFVFGFMTWVAKHVWIDRGKTQTFAELAVICTLARMACALFFSWL